MKSYGRILKWVAGAAVAFCCLCLVITLNITAKQTEKVEEVSGSLSYFQNFTLQGLDGETFTQSDLKGYQVTVFNGWATWCGPCTNEMPDLEELSQEYAEKGLQIVGIVADYYNNSSETDESIRSVLDSCGITYQILLSDEAFYNEPYISMDSAFPCTWAVDENGNIIEIVHGAKSKETWEEYFDAWLSRE